MEGPACDWSTPTSPARSRGTGNCPTIGGSRVRARVWRDRPTSSDQQYRTTDRHCPGCWGKTLSDRLAGNLVNLRTQLKREDRHTESRDLKGITPDAEGSDGPPPSIIAQEFRRTVTMHLGKLFRLRCILFIVMGTGRVRRNPLREGQHPPESSVARTMSFFFLRRWEFIFRRQKRVRT